jgi:hypothetical protein
MRRFRDTSLITFLYPGAERWLESFLGSIRAQTDPGFSIIFFQDNCDLSPRVQSSEVPFRCIRLDGQLTPNQVRLSALQYLRDLCGDHLLLFADVDDLQHPRRVQTTKSRFSQTQFPIMFSDLDLVDGAGNVLREKIWSNRLGVSVTHEDLLISNCIGFGNSAMVAGAIPKDLPVSSTPVLAPDWFYFYCAMKDLNLTAGFIPEAMTFYRQHSDNQAGLTVLDHSRVDRALDVLESQFMALAERYSDRKYVALREQLTSIKNNMRNSSFRLSYVESLNKNRRSDFFWWEGFLNASDDQRL